MDSAARARATPKPTRSSRAERLRAQQQQIARRLDHCRTPGARHQLPRTHRAAGTINASTLADGAALDRRRAAAAGLFVGVALGASYRVRLGAAAPLGAPTADRSCATRASARGLAPSPTAGPVRAAPATHGRRRGRRLPVRSRDRARPAAHARAAALRRVHAARQGDLNRSDRSGILIPITRLPSPCPCLL